MYIVPHQPNKHQNPQAILISSALAMAMGIYTWRPLPRSKPIQPGYLEPTMVQNKTHTKIRVDQLMFDRQSINVDVVCSLGNRENKDDLIEHIIQEWGVHLAFNIKNFGCSFEVIFKTRYDHQGTKNKVDLAEFHLTHCYAMDAWNESAGRNIQCQCGCNSRI